MVNRKRRGADGSEVRTRIIEAASEIIVAEGFNAVSAPRLAEHTGLHRPLIYYYFDDMDEVRLAAVRFSYAHTKALAVARIATDDPAEVLWRIFEQSSAPLSELLNYSLRGEAFRLLLSEITADLRTTFVEALRSCADHNSITRDLGPAGLAMLIQTVSTALANERRLGLTSGHSEVRAFFATVLGIRTVSSAHDSVS